MVFSSLTFLWIFLPTVLLVNYLFSLIKKADVKMRCKNTNLLIASLVFYAWGGIDYLFIMLASILGNYLFALWINQVKNNTTHKAGESAVATANTDTNATATTVTTPGMTPAPEKRRHAPSAKCLLILAIIFNLGLLFYFKYTNFLVQILEHITRGNFGLREVILPIGISFFTFQAMSYVIDVYLGKVTCQKNLLLLALYISLFPQLIAGPIVKYKDIENQLINRQESMDNFVIGIKRFLYGLAKKVIIANTCNQIATTIFTSPIDSIGTGMAWLGVICEAIQVYYDFSGYSDMAIGLGKMFGFSFAENFNYPYTSLSITEFWRRWHISLGSWFKEYIYIPLGGNRKGQARTLFNLFFVFSLTGIWHSANFASILWGICYGIIIVIERLFLKKWLDKNPIKLLNWLYTILVVMLLGLLIRAGSISYTFSYLGKLFNFSKGRLILFATIDLFSWIAIFGGIIFCGFAQRLLAKPYQKYKTKTWFFWADFALQICLFFLCITLLINDTFNPFIYFQF